jgi:hypothetical protein
VLAIANDTSPWLPPEEGARIIVPYNLTLIATGSENIVTIAYKFLGNATQAWILDRYNNLKGRELRRGDVLLVPLSDLPLTEAGEVAARESCTRTQWQGCEGFREVQRRVAAELPALIADVRSARYADAITRGTRFVAGATLTEPQLAVVHRQLLEAYVALDAIGLATASCDAWRRHDPKAKLDPVLLSPKVISACERGGSAGEKPTTEDTTTEGTAGQSGTAAEGTAGQSGSAETTTREGSTSDGGKP